MPNVRRILSRDKALVGMVHVRALPGSPRSKWPVSAIADAAAREAALLAEAGFDAVMIENMHDVPYVNGPHGPEVVAAMAVVGLAVQHALARFGRKRRISVGVQVLSAGAREALAVALAIGAEFVRVENFVFAHVADEGLMAEAQAGPLLRYRRAIGAESVALLCDIKKKHASHAITADVSIGEAAEAAEFFGADGLIVTGPATGKPTSEQDLAEVRAASRLPLLVGSGATPENVAELFEHADAIIVGSWIKKGGRWSADIDPRRTRQMVQAADRAR
jgi:membrane complex biogenesis BtpA family protein